MKTLVVTLMLAVGSCTAILRPTDHPPVAPENSITIPYVGSDVDTQIPKCCP